MWKKNLSSSESIFRTVHSMFHHVGERREENLLLHNHTKCWIGFSYSIKQALNNVTQDMEVKYKQQWENNNLKSESEERLLTIELKGCPSHWLSIFVRLATSVPPNESRMAYTFCNVVRATKMFMKQDNTINGPI